MLQSWFEGSTIFKFDVKSTKFKRFPKIEKMRGKNFPMGPKLEFGILSILQFEFSNYAKVKNLKKVNSKRSWSQYKSIMQKYFHLLRFMFSKHTAKVL
jgi:hypothetical protein